MPSSRLPDAGAGVTVGRSCSAAAAAAAFLRLPPMTDAARPFFAPPLLTALSSPPPAPAPAPVPPADDEAPPGAAAPPPLSDAKSGETPLLPAPLAPFFFASLAFASAAALSVTLTCLRSSMTLSIRSCHCSSTVITSPAWFGSSFSRGGSRSSVASICAILAMSGILLWKSRASLFSCASCSMTVHELLRSERTISGVAVRACALAAAAKEVGRMASESCEGERRMVSR
mmetsp:Transcript_6677/g.22217  ORF Transcript_6677/g.22217 Transcript_6677/m.22217 type:complete len:230 (-) Transcript_6677:1293-1982(-)